MENGERKNVFEVYNKIAHWFAQNRYEVLEEQSYLDQIINGIKPGATVLDLGCGTGKPILGYLLSKGLTVVGVDASPAILEIAKDNFPSANFILADMRSVHLNQKFDAIIAWHSFFHLPAEDQPPMFPVFEQHINPNGYLLFTSGTERGEAWGMNGGENLFHASLDKTEYEALLTQHHFVLIKYTENDLSCGGANVWLAQYKPR